MKHGCYEGHFSINGVGGLMMFLRRFLYLVLSFALVLAPIRAYAVFPLAILPGIQLVFASSSVTLAASSSAMATGYAAALAMTGALLAVNFEKPDTSVALSVRLNDKSPIATPSGWDSPPSAGAPPGPPSTNSGTTMWNATCNGCGWGPTEYIYESAIAAATFFCTMQGRSDPSVRAGNHPACDGGTYNNDATFFLGSALICPSGYTAGSGVCDLTTPLVVPYPSDEVATAADTGTTGAMDFDTRDPDSSGTPPNTFTRSSDGKTITVRSEDGRSSATIASQADGSKLITQVVGRGDGTSDRLTLSIAPKDSQDSEGGTRIQGAMKDRVIGEGSVAELTGSSGGSMNCEGCATEGTLQGVKTAVDAIKNTLDTSGVTQSQRDLQSQRDALDAAATARGTALTEETQVTSLGLGLAVTWPTSGCTDPSFAIPGGRGSLVIPMCAKRDNIQSIMNWFVGILTAFVLFSIGIAAIRRS